MGARLGVVLLCAAAVVLGLRAPRARALSSFGRFGSAAGQLDEPNGIAVDQGSGDVYVVDTNNRRVAKFTKDGAFVLAFGWGVADGRTRELQTCTTACHEGLRGAGSGQLGFAEGVAVDNDPRSPSRRDVYIVDLGQYRVEKFSPTGEFLLMFGTAGTAEGQFEFAAEDSFIAVGAVGTVYVGDRNRVQEFSPAGVFESQLRFPPPEEIGPEAGGIGGLAVDTAGDLYVVRTGVSGVREYGPTGEPLRTLDDKGEAEIASGPTPAIAVDSAGDVFIDDFASERHSVLLYGSPVHAPLRFDVGTEDGLHGIAVGERSRSLYVVSTSGNTRPPTAHVRVVALPWAARQTPAPGAAASRGEIPDPFEYGLPVWVWP